MKPNLDGEPTTITTAEPPKTYTLSCPSCGGPIAEKTPGATAYSGESAYCAKCNGYWAYFPVPARIDEGE